LLLQDIFLNTVAILQKVVADEQHAIIVARHCSCSLVKQWEGIAQIIGRKMDMERKYIARLEGECKMEDRFGF
jgi:hypothetical protein